MMASVKAGFAACLLALAIAAPASAADPVEDFYKGKQITIIVGSDAGGGYDTSARLMARFMGKYIPGNPTFIVQNLAGAGGVAAINQVVNIAAKDGTIIGGPQSGSALEPAFHQLSPGGDTAKFDGTKLQWIGSVEQAIYFFLYWNSSPIYTFDDMLNKESVVGATAANTDEGLFSQLMNNLFHTKLKIIMGYKSAVEIALAVERGELMGALNTYSSLRVKQPTWLPEKKIRIPVQLTLQPFAPLGPDVPMALDLLKNEDDKQVLRVILAKSKMARPYFMADGVPADRVAAIRKAFVTMMKDPEYVAEANKSGLDVNPVSAEEIQATIARVYSTPEPLLKRVREMIGGK
jgi:tripartite-type tricarboxylate transporter receptor subunit TctC